MDQNSEPSETQQEITSQPVLTSRVPNEASNSSPWRKILFWILGLAILLGATGGSYYLGVSTSNKNSYQRSQQPTSAPINSPTATMKPTIVVSNLSVDTSNWKTYSPPNNAYSFKYPDDNNWKLTEVKGSYFVSPDVQCPHIACPQPYNVYDFAGGISNVKSIDEYMQSLNTTNPADSSHADPYIQDYQRIKISGLDAVETLIQAGKLADSGPSVTVFIVSRGQGYSFGYTYIDVNLNTVTRLNQLPKPNPDFLSTLQFTN